MAAPSGTKWGSIVGGYGRIGIYVSVSNISNTQSKRHTEVWFWSKYSVRDSSNTFYYNDNSTSATTSMGSRNISTSVDSGSGWSTSNQQKISEADYTFDRWSSSRSYNVAAKLSGIDRVGGTMYCTTSYTIPAKPSYTVTFVNGYGGTIKSQTVYYGESASAPANPTRTGYSFAGWSGSYTNVTSSRTITATWSIWKYLISYDANGGSGAPGSQSKDYGSSIILSSTRPTRANYNFLGWAASASGDVAYSPGSTYSENASIKLYAVWQLAYQKPRISGFTAQRCNSAGTASESGTCGMVSFNWATDRAVTAVYVQWKAQSASTWSSLSIGGASTTVSNEVFGDNGLSAETSYIVRVYVSDSGGTTYSSELTLGTIKYPIDVKAGGTGIAFGKVAETADLFDVGWLAQFRRGFKGGWISEPVSGRGYSKELIHVPYVGYNEFGSNTDTSNYFKEWLKWICAKYPNKTGATFIGAVGPNSQGTAICYIYNTSDTSNGLPKYSGGFYIYLNGGGFYFGTSSYNYNYRYYNDIWWSDIKDKPGLIRSVYANDFWGMADNNGSTTNWIRTTASGIIPYQSGGSSALGTQHWPFSEAWIDKLQFGDGSSRIYDSNTNNIYVESDNGFVSLYSYKKAVYADFRYVDSNWSSGNFYPGSSTKNGTALGHSNYRWYRLYAANACSTSSDRRLKDNIVYFNDVPRKYNNPSDRQSEDNIFEDFFFKLKPSTFTTIDDTFNRIKFGYIAQDVIQALADIGLTAYDVDFVSHGRDENNKIDENAMYSLCYEEFIALNTHMIQKAHRKIEAQQKEIDDLKSQVQELKGLVLKLSNIQ